MLLKKRLLDDPAATTNKFRSIPTLNGVYTEFGIDPVQESDFFSHTTHDNLDSIVRDIRYTHITDRTTTDPQLAFTEIKEKFDRAIQLGSNEE